MSFLADLLAPAALDAATAAALDAHYLAAADARDAHRALDLARHAHAVALRTRGYDFAVTDAAATRLHRAEAIAETASARLLATPDPTA